MLIIGCTHYIVFLENTWVLYICVSFWLLAHESRDVSQAETKIAEQFHKMITTYFHSK